MSKNNSNTQDKTKQHHIFQGRFTGNLVCKMSSEMTPLQKSVLERYQSLAESLRELKETLSDLNNTHENSKPEEILQEMREIEVKISLVSTLMKGAVYSLVLQRWADKNPQV